MASPVRRVSPRSAPTSRALGRIFLEAVALEQGRAAGIAVSQHAAGNHIQRFGGSFDLNLHFHAIIADGAFAADDTAIDVSRKCGLPVQNSWSSADSGGITA